PLLTGKRFETLKEAVPGLIRLAYSWNPTNPAAQSDLRDAEAAARRLGLQLHPVGVKGDDDLNAAFARASKDDVRGLVVMSDFVLYGLQAGSFSWRHSIGFPGYTRRNRSSRPEGCWGME